MLLTADHPVPFATIVAVLVSAALAGIVAARWPRSALVTWPLLYLWMRSAEYPVGYSSESHIIPFQVSMLLPVIGALAGLVIRRRRAPA